MCSSDLQLFIWLLVEQQSVEEVCRLADLSADAVYAWRSRLGKLVRTIVLEVSAEGADFPSDSRGRARMPLQSSPTRGRP